MSTSFVKNPKTPKSNSETSHLFHLSKTKPQTIRSGGSRIDVNALNFPRLSGLAISLLTLEPKAIREPHWHPNAHELGYVISGKALMTIFSPGAGHDTFTLDAGEIAFVPMGYLHHIENIGATPLQMLICFSHEQVEDLSISSSIGVMPPHVLGATFAVKPSFFTDLHAKEDPKFITNTKTLDTPSFTSIPNRFKYSLDASNPQIDNQGGVVRMSNNFFLPELEGLALYSLVLKKNGIREPHWHPNAHELNYLIKGSARITILSPSGYVDTFDMEAGDMSFLPKGYIHHIENTGQDDAYYAVFFSHATPSDIGLSGSLGAYSNNVLGSLFDVPPAYFDNLPKYQQDLFVVSGGG